MKQHLFSIFYIAALFLGTHNAGANPKGLDQIDSNLYIGEDVFYIGYGLYYSNPEKSKQYFEGGAAFYKERKDTAFYIKCKLALGIIERRQGHYNKAFDIIWDVLEEVKDYSDPSKFSDIHRSLGMMYHIYGKDSLALYQHNKSLSIDKKYNNYRNMGNTYFEMAALFIDMPDYDKALAYLDSCYLVAPNKERLVYVDAYYGLIYTQKKDFKKATNYLDGLIPIYKKDSILFLAQLYDIHGDLKNALNQKDSAIYYYKNSIEVIDLKKTNQAIKPKVLEKIADAYFESNNATEAYGYMKNAKVVSDSLFNTHSNQNRELFEIKNKFRSDLVKKEELLQSKEYVLELRIKASNRLKFLIGILIFSALVFIGFLFFRFKMKQKLYQQQLEKEQSDAILELKNKELISNALQIIEKENAYNALLERIKQHDPILYKKEVNQYRKNTKRIWEDFHLRFTKTNDKFYDSLLKLHPTLTALDLKNCALIKLNFDSKEMSLILGISINSVHVARSRIRKKLNLSRDQNLSSYLAGVWQWTISD